MADLSLTLRGQNLTKQEFAELKRDIDATNQAIRQSAAETDKLTKSTQGAKSATKEWAESMQANSAAMQQTGMVIAAAGAAITAALGLAVKTAADFQQAMANTQSVVGGTAEDLAILTDYAREMGKESVFSAKQAADAMYYLASAGLQTADIVKSLAGTLNLAAATQADLAFSTRIVVSNIAAFGLAAEDADRVANTFAATISGSQATIDKLATSMAYIAPIARGVGMSIEQTAGMLGILYNNGIDASTAGTALRGAISRLLKPTDDAAAVLKRMGIEVLDSTKNLRPLIDIIRELETVGLSTADAIELFGLRAGPGMITLVNTGADAIQALIDKVTGTNKASEMAAMQINTFQGQLRLLKSAVEELQISIGDVLLPTLTNYGKIITGIINKTTDWAKAHQALTNLIVQSSAILGITMIAGGGMFIFIAGLASLTRNLPLAIAGLSKFIGLLKVLAFSTAGGVIAGIVSGIILLAGATALFKKAVDDTRKSLIDYNSVTGVMKRNMAGIRDEIWETERQITALAKAHEDGLMSVDRYDKALGRIRSYRIGEAIGLLRDKIKELNKQLAIEGGDIYLSTIKEAADRTALWSKVMVGALHPMDAFAGLMRKLAESVGASGDALLDLSKYDYSFTAVGGLQSIADHLNDIIAKAKTARDALDLTITREQRGTAQMVALPGMARPGIGAQPGQRPVMFEGVDTGNLKQGIKDTDAALKEFEETWAAIAIKMLPEKEALDQTWAELEKSLRVGLEHGKITEAQLLQAKADHYKEYNANLLKMQLETTAKWNDLAEDNLEKDIAFQEEAAERANEIRQEEVAEAIRIQGILDAIEHQREQRRLALLAHLSEAEKEYYDLITGLQNDFSAMTIEQLGDVSAAWQEVGDSIKTGFMAAIISLTVETINWYEEFVKVINGVRQAFSDFIYTSLSDIDSFGDAWNAFVDDMKRVFIRAIADMAAKQIMIQIGNAVKGTDWFNGLTGGTGVTPTSAGGGETNIIGLLSGIAQAVTGIATANPALIVSGSAQTIGSFDVPAHDMMARRYGWIAGLQAASFDDPLNDIRARRAGSLQATRDLGYRSAKDMLDNFYTGWSESAGGLSRGSGNAALLDAINDLKANIQNPPAFDLIVDGKQIHAAVMRRDDKVRSRGSAY